MITDQGLRESLLAILEFGYQACRKGLPLDAAKREAAAPIQQFVTAAKLPKELLRIKTRK